MQPVFPSVASPEDITSDYFKRLTNCDVVITILGTLYSKHVENEFLCALNNEIPVLVLKKNAIVKVNCQIKSRVYSIL